MTKKQAKPVEALNDACVFDRMRTTHSRFDALRQRIEAGYAGVVEAVGMYEIQAAVDQDRLEQRRLQKVRNAGDLP